MFLQIPNLASMAWLEHGFGTRVEAGWPPEYVNLRQIHSDVVVSAGPDARGMIGEGDGLVTSQPGLWIGVRTADCAPVILADPIHRAVAAVHAGWRGTANQIVARAVQRMRNEFGTLPGDLAAAVGPTIGSCCYQVGQEVARQFQPWWPERDDLDRQTHIDVAATLGRQLTDLGVANVTVAGECTRCRANLYHSFRRDGEAAGRMVSAVRIRP